MSERYTPERRAAFARVVRAARSFVCAVDEFGEDDRSAHGERMEELINAIDAEARTWDEGPDAPPVALEVETVEPPTRERVTRRG
mgnify:CR=1 FL=1